MTEELITRENLSKELLKSILDSAFMDSSFDSEGDLIVHDEVRCFVVFNEAKDRIGLFTGWFGFEPSTSQLQRLELVNRINSEYVVVKAYARKDDSLQFGYDILVGGGITKKAFVLALKRFCSIPRMAIREHGAGIVA